SRPCAHRAFCQVLCRLARYGLAQQGATVGRGFGGGSRMDANGDPRVVLVHDWLTGMRGGEKCLEVLCRRWPHAPLFTLLHRRGAVAPSIERLALRPSFLQQLPAVHRYYRYLLPLMPAAAASW